MSVNEHCYFIVITLLLNHLGRLPFAVKLKQGSIFSEVFKVLYFSSDSTLVNSSIFMKMEIETKTVLRREWLSLKEFYAANLIARCCEEYQVIFFS